MAGTFRAWMVRSAALRLGGSGRGGGRGCETICAGAGRKGAPTFTKDIAPIFQSKCEACHRPNNMAPMSLISYEDARPWARAIAQRVETRQMPPWHIDSTIGIQSFKNDRSLSDEQIDTIVRWVAAGAPKGDPKDMPAPKQWPDESKWQLAGKFGPPDLVIKSAPYTMPAAAQDAWWRPVSDTGLTEPRWVRAIEIRPSTMKGRRITHHALARLQQTENLQQRAVHQRSERRRRRSLHGMGRRQERRRDAPGLGPPDAARIEDRVGSALPRRRRGDHRLGRARRLFLSEGSGAEASRGAGAVQHVHRRRGRISTFRRIR